MSVNIVYDRTNVVLSVTNMAIWAYKYCMMHSNIVYCVLILFMSVLNMSVTLSVHNIVYEAY